MQETKLHPDDTVSIADLEIRCAACRGTEKMSRSELVTPAVEIPQSHYVYRCAHAAVVVVVPHHGRTLETVLGDPGGSQETRLHPDDTVPLSLVGFLFDDRPLRRIHADRVVDERGDRSYYTYADTTHAEMGEESVGSKLTVSVPRRAEATAAAA